MSDAGYGVPAGYDEDHVGGFDTTGQAHDLWYATSAVNDCLVLCLSICMLITHFAVLSLLVAGVLFDVLFNLHKFLRFEQRDPFQEKMRREDIFHTDWDRFAHAEYNRLAQEEEDEGDYLGGSGGVGGGYGEHSAMDVDGGSGGGGAAVGAGGVPGGVEDLDDEDDDVGGAGGNGGGLGGRRTSWTVMHDEESDEDEDEDEALLGNRLVQRRQKH